MSPTRTQLRRLTRAFSAWAASFGLAAPAAAQSSWEHGFEFRTIGAPGNRATTDSEALWPSWAPPLGAVEHDYRIMRTNVTYQQYLPFLEAYAPHHAGNPWSHEIMGLGLNFTGYNPQGAPTYSITPGQENCTATMTWRTAARFVNWLHNGKVNQPWAFDNGAYDTSTFGTGPNGQLTDQITHNPGAKYWIPTLNEYVKAAYYDPSRYGPGQEGYWLYPDGGMDPLVAGPPGIGEAAGNTILPLVNIPVGSYPETQSPWGLWDVSSTETQATEGVIHPTTGLRRMRMGSRVGSEFYWLHDRLDSFPSTALPVSSIGLRVATAVPSPGSMACVVWLAFLVTKRRIR